MQQIYHAMRSIVKVEWNARFQQHDAR